MLKDRSSEHQRVLDMITDLGTLGVSLFKLSMMCNRPYNTVKHWKKTGRVESYDLKLIEQIYGSCTMKFCEVSHIATSVPIRNAIQSRKST